jgi:uncharacterized protein YpmB
MAKNNKKNDSMIVLVLGSLLIILVLVTAFEFYFEKRKDQKNNTEEEIITSEMTQSQSLPAENIQSFGDIYPITSNNTSINENFNKIRYQCKNNKMVTEIGSDENSSITGITIMPSRIKLEKVDSTSKFISYTFDKECKYIYALVNYNSDNSMDIFRFDVKTGKYTKLTNGLSPRWTTPGDSKPSAFFIYAINDKKLLVTFFKVTTGLDAMTNFSIHKIFDLNKNDFTKEIVFGNDDPGTWVAPPTILNFKNNVLSNVVEFNGQKKNKSLVRQDFDLISEKFIKSENLDTNLVDDNNLSLTGIGFECFPDENNMEEYSKCVKENLNNVFPRSKN